MATTYQDLIDQYSNDIQTAEKASKPEVVYEKLSALVETYIDLATKCMREMNFAEANLYFNHAYDKALAFEEFAKEAGQQPSDQLMKRNKRNLLQASAFANMSSGLYSNGSRNPGAAAVNFEKANKDFADLYKQSANPEWNIYSKYSDAMVMYAQGLENFYRTSFANSKAHFQRAMVGLASLIEKELPIMKAELNNDDAIYNNYVSQFKSDYQAFKSYYHISDARQQFNTRNFKSAARQFAAAAKEFDTTVKNYGNAISEAIKNINLGEFHQYSGWQKLSEAENNREEEKWEEAIACYDSARLEWEQAANYYLQSGLPSASALQESILNIMLSVDVYQKACEDEKELKTTIADLEQELSDLKATLANAVRPAGVVVNNNNSNTNANTQEVINTVSLNAQFVQHIENNARAEVEKLLAALKETALDDNTKKDIEKKGKDILASPEKGTRFLDKVKDFTGDLAAIVKNVGDIASPLIPGWKFLSALFF